jgi:NAD(P)-dependent dehydrogenase (short-subunit alcohol dehydrogenase family)
VRKIIITGSSGLIGSEVTSYFKNTDDVIECDLSLGHNLNNEEFVKRFFKENNADYLINLFALNHHIGKNGDDDNLFNISLESFDDYLKVNLTSLFSVCREFARNNKIGSIVNFSSTYGCGSPIPSMYVNEQKHIGYGVSKAGVIQLTKHLAIHLAPNIRVNNVVPGGVRFKQDEDFVKRYSEHTPMGRMMNVNELTGVLDFLCSDHSSYVTGESIKVDGGWTAW